MITEKTIITLEIEGSIEGLLPKKPTKKQTQKVVKQIVKTLLDRDQAVITEFGTELNVENVTGLFGRPIGVKFGEKTTLLTLKM